MLRNSPDFGQRNCYCSRASNPPVTVVSCLTSVDMPPRLQLRRRLLAPSVIASAYEAFPLLRVNRPYRLPADGRGIDRERP
jgi:hypothetical protein